METKNFAVPLGVFVVFAIGLALMLNPGTHKAEEETAVHPSATQPATAPAPVAMHPATSPQEAKLLTLFDGKTLTNWKSSDFGGEGPVSIDDGKIIVKAGSTLSGINWTGAELPKENYEIELDAMKLDGSDFFAALTFPYKKDYATLVLGGWGGSLVGLSSINDNDAANNETTATKEFKKNQWYHIRLRATPTKIQAWVDDQNDPILDVETTDKRISTRADIDAARPLGLSTYQTSAAYKNIQLRKL
jgi:hypothetical protein